MQPVSTFKPLQRRQKEMMGEVSNQLVSFPFATSTVIPRPMKKVSSGAAGSKQGTMSSRRPAVAGLSLFTTPAYFIGFSANGFPSGPEAPALSPTSVLDARPLSPVGKPFVALWSPRRPSSEAVGFGIVEALSKDETNNKPCKPDTQILPVCSDSISLTGNAVSEDDGKECGMVVSHGPNPRFTFVFEDCIATSCGTNSDGLSYRWDGFLNCCYACKRDLGQKSDIFMYRGEKAFCSQECRQQEMLLDEWIESANHGSLQTRFSPSWDSQSRRIL